MTAGLISVESNKEGLSILICDSKSTDENQEIQLSHINNNIFNTNNILNINKNKRRILRERKMLEESFTPSRKLLEWASENVPSVDIHTETKRFIVYWTSEEKKIARVDWDRSWQNWMLNAQGRIDSSKITRQPRLIY